MLRLLSSRVLRNVSSQLTTQAKFATKSRNVIGVRRLCSSLPNLQKEEVEFTFIRASGERIKAKGKVGDSLLDVIVNSNLDFDGFGACEGTLTCSTCHLIFSKPDFDKLPDKPSDDELDMLDLAFDLTDTSRLGCQIYLSKDMEGLEVKVPTTVNDARS